MNLCSTPRALTVIREERKKQGVSMDAMAQAMGMTRQNYGRKESGQRHLSYADFRQMVNILGIDLGRFNDEKY